MDGEAMAAEQVAAEEEQREWAILEIFGHRRHAGRIQEIERFGAKMLRIDIPQSGAPDAPMVSHFYGGASIFSLTLTDEATARRMNKRYDEPSLYLPGPDHSEERQPDEEREEEPFL